MILLRLQQYLAYFITTPKCAICVLGSGKKLSHGGPALIYADLGYYYYRPVNDAGERVPPENLSDHRQTHNFQLPCCFCAVTTTAYTEMSIFVAIDGDFAGEYVAGCQNDRCGYLICIERLYTKVGLPLKRYSLRGRISVLSNFRSYPHS